MAGAGSIILNIPGRAGPYRVRPQRSVFARPMQQPGQGLRTASDVMTLLTQAKGLADMVAPFITTQQPAAQQFDESRQAAQEAIADVQGMRAAQDEQRAAQSLQAGATDLAQARQAMESARTDMGIDRLGMMQARDAARPAFGSPVQQLEQAVARVNAAQTPEELAAAQADYEHARMLLQNQGALDAPRPLSALESPLIQAAAQGAPQMPIMPPAPGLSLPGVLPPAPPQEPVRMLDPETMSQLAQPAADMAGMHMPEPTPPSTAAAPTPPPEVGAELRGTGFHPEDEVVRFGSLAEAQAAMMAASANNDVAAYNRAVQALEFSPLSDVRPQSMADVITGDHFRRAKMGLMQAIKPPTAPTALDRARLADIQSRIEDRAFKQVMAIQGDDRAQTDMLRKQALAQMTLQMQRAKLPGAIADSIKKGVEARVWGKQLASQRAKNFGQAARSYAAAADIRHDLKFKRDFPDIYKGQQFARTASFKEQMQWVAMVDKGIRQDKAEAERSKRAIARGTAAGRGASDQSELNRLDREIRQGQAVSSQAQQLIDANEARLETASTSEKKKINAAITAAKGARAKGQQMIKSAQRDRKVVVRRMAGNAANAPTPEPLKPEPLDLSDFEIPE